MRPMSEYISSYVDSLEYNWEQFQIEDFAQFVARMLQRPLLLVAYPFDGAISATWIRGQRREFIFFRSDAPAVVRTHGILHELGHLFLDHEGHRIDEGGVEQLLETLAQTKLSIEDRLEEQEAERFAQIVMMRIRDSKRTLIERQGTTILGLRAIAESGF